MRLLTELGTMSTPMLLNQLMKCIADKDNWIAPAGQHRNYEGYVLALMMFVVAIMTSVSVGPTYPLQSLQNAPSTTLIIFMIIRGSVPILSP